MNSRGLLKRPEDLRIVLSVIIVNYKTSAITIEAVRSVLSEARELPLEVIVVDNNSEDGSVDDIRRSCPGIQVIASPVNGGYAFGNNLGMSASAGKYVLVLNSDALIRPGALRTAVTYLENNPNVGLLGCRVWLENGQQQSTLFRYHRLGQVIFRMLIPDRVIRASTWFGDQRYAGLSRERIQDVEVVAGCFMLVPRRVIAAAGGMDERFFMYSEESEWCFRIRQHGFKVHYNPAVEIMHHGAASTGQVSPWKAVEIARSQLLFIRLTQGAAHSWLAGLIMLAGDMARSLVFLPKIVSGNADRYRPWLARLKFLACALVRPPKGQETRSTDIVIRT
jgi:N-acetylglucosaminyl-diphospho-decaprenol L-rhamnosyltransferase